jgi:hypothetical protein
MDTTKLTTLPTEISSGLVKEFDKSPRMDPFGRNSDHVPDRKIQAIFYGRQGCGKTVLMANIAANYGGKICYLDSETSSEVFRDHQHLYDMAEWDFPEMFPGLSELAYLMPIWAKEKKYDTVVIDSMTSAIGLDLRDILLNAGFTRGSAKGFKELSTLQDYGVLLNRLIWLFDVAIRCRMNLLVAGHARVPNEAEARRGAKTCLFLTDKQEVQVGLRIANVWYCANEFNEKGERVRRVYTRETEEVEAKCRISQLPDRLTSDSLVRRLDAYRQGIEYIPQSKSAE